MEIFRLNQINHIKDRLNVSPIVAILGPRQCGKTTLARQFSGQKFYSEIHFFDLEDPRYLARLENPMLTLEPLTGLIIIDEIQRKPDLFPVLRVIADNYPQKRFLILGSASRDLIFRSSETLAGRIGFHELGGFSVDEIKSSRFNQLWMRGGFPRSFLAEDNLASYHWREDFIRTFLEKDIPGLGIQIPPVTLRRFLGMLSHYHGQVFNASEIGKSLNLSDKTVKRYLDILTGTFLIRQLPAWFYNTSKRIVKRPKIYFRDSGLFHSFLAVEDINQLMMHPRLGASWEGFALEQFIRHHGLKDDEVYFWSVHTGAQLDLVFRRKGKMWGVEFKYNEAPKITPSMRSALEELNLNHLWIVHPGQQSYVLAKNITAIGLDSMPDSPDLAEIFT